MSKEKKPNPLTKVTDSVKQLATTLKNVILNGERFIQASALLILAGWGYWSVNKLHPQLDNWFYYVVLTALVIIGLRGFYELVRFLDRKDK